MENKKNDSYILRIIKGIIISLGFVLPGVSGGVLAAVLGIYDRLIHFIANIRKDFVKNFLYFVPVGIGGILGIGLFSAPLEWLLEHYTLIVLWAFAGAIIGTIPSLWSDAVKISKKRDATDIAVLLITFIGGFLFLYFLPNIVGTLQPNFYTFILAGALIALGVLVPGLSPSNLLLVLGLYSPMLAGFKKFDLAGTFLPIAIGGVLAMVLFSKAMEWLLDNAYSRVYHFIIGIVLASTIMILIPPISDYSQLTGVTVVISLLLFGLGFWLGQWMSELEGKYK
ncbi:MAG: DUF368 domain-containing protein [Lactobacillaceae bacterium]|jgi:putative membrane protein|nr:DUF368 domain-containing protein [Lactobacillaceae bacterium]